MKTSLLTLTLLLPLAFPHASRRPSASGTTPAVARRECGEVVLREGPLPSAGRLRLGKPVEFDDGAGINGGRCYPLFEGGELVAWIDAYHRAGPRIFLRRCVENPSLRNVAPGSKGGAVEEAFDELRLDGRSPRARFVRLEPPLWSEFSHPSFCGDHLAYWGTEFKEGGPVEVFAVAFDLNAGKVIRREALGSVLLESDSRSFFPRPQWGEGGKSITFDPRLKDDPQSGRPALGTVTLRLK